MSHTFAILEVSRAAYDEIAAKLREAGYDHAFIPTNTPDVYNIDMHGIGLRPLMPTEDSEPHVEPPKCSAETAIAPDIYRSDRSTSRLDKP